PRKEWEGILAKKNLSEITLRDRYSGVVHLLTAADGAPEHYSGDGNPARLESTMEDAIKADTRTRNAWLGHPRFVVVDNSTCFEEKIKKTLNIILHHLGYPAQVGEERRFLVRDVDFDAMPEHRKIEIEQTYLTMRTAGQETRLKRRGQDGSCMYFIVRRDLTAKRGGGFPREEEEIISREDYSKLLGMKDSRLNPVVKERFCFVWKNSHFELDFYKRRNQGLVILETGLMGHDAPLPPFVEVGEEITGNREYVGKRLASRKTRSVHKPVTTRPAEKELPLEAAGKVSGDADVTEATVIPLQRSADTSPEEAQVALGHGGP
ncbi:MAG TPA: hypothetical protein PKJ17_10730, partial [Syntrophorhabdaceae bacterium]|nr:hypothetical protein [Syntrophorhabdaceae bacterium]